MQLVALYENRLKAREDQIVKLCEEVGRLEESLEQESGLT